MKKFVVKRERIEFFTESAEIIAENEDDALSKLSNSAQEVDWVLHSAKTEESIWDVVESDIEVDRGFLLEKVALE